jgi:hypothetical protein
VRRLDPQVLEGVRRLLPFDRSMARTGEQILRELRLGGIAVNHVRRVQEAIRHLRVVEHVTVASGPFGYWIEKDPDVLALTLVTRKRRIRHDAESVRAIDPDLADRLTRALDFGGTP